MAEATSRVRAWASAAALPVTATVAVFGWAYWCFGGSSAPSATVAMAGGAVLLLASCAGYLLLVGGSSGGLFGTLLLALVLLLTVAAADQAAARGAAATCVVRDVRTTVQPSFGEAGPHAKTVYRLALDCPGGYPDELKGDRPVAAPGAEVRVAYDPRRRVAPEVEGTTSPWRAATWALILLALSTVIAGSRRAPDEAPGPGS